MNQIPSNRGRAERRVSWSAGFALAAVCIACPVAGAPSSSPRRSLTGKPWIDMDYGPFKTHSLEVAKGNIANKSIAIRIDPGEGGVSSGNEFVLFETDTLRYAAGWTGPEFCDWRNIMHDGEHVVHASIVGHTVFANPDAPGWADAQGQFQETRFHGRDGRYYGPMDRNVGQWKGLYLHGDQVILSYRIGRTAILELPGGEGGGSLRALTRTLNLGPRDHDLIVQVVHQAGGEAQIRSVTAAGGREMQVAVFPEPRQQTRPGNDGSQPWITLDGKTRLVVNASRDLSLADHDTTVFARVKTQKGGTILSRTALNRPWAPLGMTLFLRDGRLVLDRGWVGAVESTRTIHDGKWHRIAMTYEHQTGRVRLYVDGKPDGQGVLKLPEDAEKQTVARWNQARKNHQIQLGYTSADFPNAGRQSHWVGQLADVRLYEARLTEREIQRLGRRRSEFKDPRLIARWDLGKQEDHDVIADATGGGHFIRIIRDPTGTEDLGNNVTVAAVVGGPSRVSWIATPNGDLRLRIPAGPSAARLKLLISQVRDAGDLRAFTALAEASPPPAELEPLTHGGPRHWLKTLTTRAEILGSAAGPFVVEAITPPFDNPYHSMMRLGGFDFFRDGHRAAVCTSMGDVWIVDGLGGDLGAFSWRRIATGMYEPLGLKIVKDQIYVTCRDQITRLHDLNGDGETDFYESFNHDQMASEHYHEFAMCLETDAAGNFYYFKAAGHNFTARFPQHGTLIKVSADGESSEIVANGFRAPNGLWVSPDGKFFLSTDQEGHWTPENKINWIVPGGFYGYMLGWHRDRDPSDFIPPLTWMHKRYENSPSRAFFMETDRWGPLNGKMASISYGKGKVFLVMYEDATRGLKQGGITPLAIQQMPTGLIRARFNPLDGQMYLCGLFVWCSDQTQVGGFYRVRYTGKPLHMPVELHVASDGVIIGFTDPLDPKWAGDPGNYNVEMWKYLRRREYGSADYKVLGSGEGHDTLAVKSVSVSADRKRVFLEIPAIQPVQQMHIDIHIRAADGTRIRTYVHHTIHALGKEPGRSLLDHPLATN